jgi:hypothetical protein
MGYDDEYESESAFLTRRTTIQYFVMDVDAPSLK